VSPNSFAEGSQANWIEPTPFPTFAGVPSGGRIVVITLDNQDEHQTASSSLSIFL
jgi:hypothetical protein